MTQENVELTYRAVEMFNRRDLDGLLALMDEDVRADPQLARMEGGYHGHEGVQLWWNTLFDEIPDFTSEIVEVRDYGDDLVIAVVHHRGHGAESAAPFEQTTFLPVRVRERKCVWWGNFFEEEDALEAAGLRE